MKLKDTSKLELMSVLTSRVGGYDVPARKGKVRVRKHFK